MVGLQGKGGTQRCLPMGEGLAGQTEHQIDIEIIETVPAQQVERSLRLRRVMLATEQLKQSIIERLHAKAKTSDAQIAQQFRLSFGNASGIRLQRPFPQG